MTIEILPVFRRIGGDVMHSRFLSLYDGSFSEERERERDKKKKKKKKKEKKKQLLTRHRPTDIVACYISVCFSSMKFELTPGTLYNWKNCIWIMVIGSRYFGMPFFC